MPESATEPAEIEHRGERSDVWLNSLLRVKGAKMDQYDECACTSLFLRAEAQSCPLKTKQS